jgi:hypothetical protein
VENSCKLGNEPSGSIKCWETTEWLHNLWPLEWYSAPQSYLPRIHWFCVPSSSSATGTKGVALHMGTVTGTGS